jgi:hypothetical protein
MTARITMFVLMAAVVLFALPASASSQQCIPDAAAGHTVTGATVPGTPWCMPRPAANPSPSDPYQSGNPTPNPRGNVYGGRLWAPPSVANLYGGYGNPSTNTPNVPLPGETIWGIPSRSRR